MYLRRQIVKSSFLLIRDATENRHFIPLREYDARQIGPRSRKSGNLRHLRDIFHRSNAAVAGQPNTCQRAKNRIKHRFIC